MSHTVNGDLLDDDAQPDAGKPNPGTTDKAVVYLLDENNNVLDWKQFEFPGPNGTYARKLKAGTGRCIAGRIFTKPSPTLAVRFRR
jgi:hypothetical protein